MQLMELGIPMVLALNMMDEVRANGGSVRVNELEEILGIPVVPISAAKNEGIEELIDHEAPFPFPKQITDVQICQPFQTKWKVSLSSGGHFPPSL